MNDTKQDLVNASFSDRALGHRDFLRMLFAHVLPQVILPHWLRLCATEVAARDTAMEWVKESMATTGIDSSSRNIVVLEKSLGVAIVLERNLYSVKGCRADSSGM
jgi:hypothetical protein